METLLPTGPLFGLTLREWKISKTESIKTLNPGLPKDVQMSLLLCHALGKRTIGETSGHCISSIERVETALNLCRMRLNLFTMSEYPLDA